MTGGVVRFPGNVERQGGRRPDEGTQLEQTPVLLQRAGEVGRSVRLPEPAPRDEVGVRRDGSRRVYLQQSQLVDKGDQVGRPGGVEQLGSHGELARLVAVEPSHAHPTRLVGRWRHADLHAPGRLVLAAHQFTAAACEHVSCGIDARLRPQALDAR